LFLFLRFFVLRVLVLGFVLDLIFFVFFFLFLFLLLFFLLFRFLFSSFLLLRLKDYGVLNLRTAVPRRSEIAASTSGKSQLGDAVEM